jgi:putative endonuclease
MRDYTFYVYILANSTKSVLYTGFTNNLEQRLIEHFMNRGKKKTFTGRYYCYYLLYYEVHQYVYNALDREKEIKGWARAKKMNLIKSENPEFKFLNKEIMEWPPTDLIHR